MFCAGGLILLYLINLVSSQTIGQATPLSQEYKDKLVDLHNQARKDYGVADLVWSDTLQKSAEEYGVKCIWAHSGAAGLGENLAIFMKDPAPAFPELMQSFRDQITGWFDEYKGWDCPTGACGANTQCGHLTQMISKRTTSVGCGIIRCPKGTPFSSTSQYMICQYSPAGNMNLQSKHPCTDASYPWDGCPKTPLPALVDVKPPPTTPPPAPKPTVPAPDTKPPPTTPAPDTKPPPTTPATDPKPTAPAPKPTAPAPRPKPSPAPRPTTPAPGPGTRVICYADYYVNNKKVIPSPACKKAPQYFSETDSTGKTTKRLYCDCGAPDRYWWPVNNPSTCNYPSALMSDSDATGSTGILPLGAWIGIGVAAFALIVIIIAIVIIVKKKQPTDERV